MRISLIFLIVILVNCLWPNFVRAQDEALQKEVKRLSDMLDSLVDKSDHWKVGDVRYSVFPPTYFERLNPGWVLMDGRACDSTNYSKLTGQDSIPDGQNMFI